MYGFTLSTPDNCKYFPTFNGTHAQLLRFMSQCAIDVEGFALYYFGARGKPRLIGTIINGQLVKV